MSLYTARTIGGGTDAIGTTLPTFRLGLNGPTFYNGSADPTVTPPTPMDDGFHDGDVYIRGTSGGSALWVYDTVVWTQIASGAGGGSFAGDIIMVASAQLLGDPAADATAPAFAFNGDEDTGMFQVGANELGFSTSGTQALIIEADGTIASTIASYETLVLQANDIPNRKFCIDTFVDIAGDAMTGDLTFGPGTQIFSASGSAAAPGIAMSLDQDNGFYLDATDSIGVSSVGARIASFNPDGIQMRNGAQFIGDSGTAGIPSIAFNGDLDTGFNHDGTAGEISLSSNGVKTMHFDGTVATGSLLWQGGAGAVGGPSMSFSGDINTGFYNSAADTIGVSAGGVLAATIDVGGIEVLNGTSVAPSYSFINDPDTGMFLTGVGFLEFAVGGVDQLQINATDIRALPPYRGASGSGAAPGFSFTADDDTGMYRAAANQLAFSTGGTERWRIGTTGDLLPFAVGADIATSGTRMGTVYATTFDGTATAAQYSDLAERYTVGHDCDLVPGDVVVICEHEDHDICCSHGEDDDRVLGVVSTKPAFMMNKDAGDDKTAPYIALRGRVPVKVYGSVNKGDLLTTSDYEGCARALTDDEKKTVSPHAVFAKALTSYAGGGYGEVEAVIL